MITLRNDDRMKGNKEVNISFWAAHATTVVSVTLVLILVGIIAFITAGAASETRRLREQIEVSAIMGDSVTNAEAGAVMKQIAAIPGVKDCRLISKEEAMADWKEQTDEDLEEVFGVNIFSPEVSFHLDASHTGAAAMAKISTAVKALPGVEEVAVPDSAMVESMNENINRISLILGVAAIVMIIISFVLINNTVHLAIYSRRFTIHTMQLVGATNRFIRLPFVRSNMFAGFLAGILAVAIMAGVMLASSQHPLTAAVLTLPPAVYAAIGGGMILTGTLLCALAASLATARYLHKDYDELFK